MLELGTHQEIFDKVANHLLTQNEPSMFDDSTNSLCAYRGSKGTMCAVGCLIPDSLYSPEFEENDVTSKIIRVLFFERDLWLLQELQRIHDLYKPIEWQDKLNNLANDSNLLPFPRNQKETQ